MNGIFKSLAFVALSFTAIANATPVLVSASGEGQTTSTVAGITTVNFNAGNCNGYASCTGDFALVTGSLSGRYAQPFGTNSTFLSVPNPSDTTHTAIMSLGIQADYFGLFWGSIDTYNTVSFFLGNAEVASFGGADLPNLIANGNQTEWSSNRYINFDFGGGTFDTVKFMSSNFAFESDNHAFRSASVPEPMNLVLMGLGLVGLVAVRRFNRS